MTKSRVGLFAAAMVACVAGTAFAEKDFGDFYTRAWYMVVDNPGPAKSLSWRVFDVCGPAEHHNNVERNPSFTIRRETDVRRVDTPWMEVNFHTNRPISVVRIRPSRKPGEEFDLYGARIFLLDKNRKIVWHHRIWNTDGQVDYDASAEFSDRDMLGQTLPEYKVVGNRVSAPPAASAGGHAPPSREGTLQPRRDGTRDQRLCRQVPDPLPRQGRTPCRTRRDHEGRDAPLRVR